jgi:hypothetical protein
MWMITRNAGICLAALGLVAGCGSSGSDGAATSRAVVRKAVNPAEAAARNMVNAVADPKGEPVPLQVRFQLRARPQPAQPVDVDLAIVPVSGSVDRIVGTVESDEGLELVDGGQIPAADRPSEGVPIQHTIRVLPKRDGIFTLTAMLTVDTAGQSHKETYSIPIIAGAGVPDLPGKAAAPAATPPKPSAPTR